jgi:hypothetical protein
MSEDQDARSDGQPSDGLNSYDPGQQRFSGSVAFPAEGKQSRRIMGGAVRLSPKHLELVLGDAPSSSRLRSSFRHSSKLQ